MNEKTSFRVLTIACALLLAAAFGTTAFADEDEVVQKRVVKKIVCEGDDCPEGEGHAIFINEDGETTELHGEGNHWVDINDEGDGRVIKIKRRHCDGDDCPEGEGHGEHKMRMRMPHAGGAYLGVQLTELTSDLRSHFGVPENAGILVAKVVDGSAAATAGLKVGDIISALDGKAVESAHQLSHAVHSRAAGDTVLLEVWRDGSVQNLSATLAESENAGHMRHRVVKVDCDGDDCEMAAGGAGADFDCGSDTCQVMVNCDGDDCSCTVNGESADCEEIPGFKMRHGK